MANPRTVRWWRSGQGLAAILGLVGAMAAALIGLRPWESEGPRVEVVSVALADGAGDLERNIIDPSSIDIRIRNIGGQVSVLHRVDLRVLDVGVLRVCEGGADLPPSATYEAVLPASTRPGDVIEVPISNALEPNTADRVVIRVFPAITTEPWQYEIVLAHLELGLAHDRAEGTVPGGRVVIATPWAPEQYWFAPELVADIQARLAAGEEIEPLTLGVYECYRDNRVVFDRITSLDGERSPALKAPAPRPG